MVSRLYLAFLSLSTIMDVYFYRLGIFFQSIFDVNSQVTWDTELVTYIPSFNLVDTFLDLVPINIHVMDSQFPYETFINPKFLAKFIN